MKIAGILKTKKPVFSFEFFPPKTDEDSARLQTALKELKSLGPDFVSITHSPSGTEIMKTASLAGNIQNTLGMNTMAHFTCVGRSKGEVAQITDGLKKMGVDNILALRGDVPPGQDPETAFTDYKHAVSLVSEIRKLGDFSIGVAGYPEKHPEAPSLEQDISYLKEKADAGADFIITQLFFNNDAYSAFLEKCANAGINLPILPGIMPVTSYKQLKKFAGMCGASIPQEMEQALNKIQNDKQAVINYGIEYAEKQCKDLLKRGAPGLHFYTLNKSHSTIEILRDLK